MAERTKIEWCDSTFNPWTGCTKVGPGCDHCYAEAWSKRAGDKVGKWGPGAPRVRTSPANWRRPMAWNAEADKFDAEHGRRRRVFCASLADVFDNEVPTLWRQQLMTLVANTPNLDWLFLTKRIGNARKMLADASMHDGRLLTANDEYRPPANLWIGATVVNQEEADRDIPKLLATPAAVRFLSMEPLLGPVDLASMADRPLWPSSEPRIPAINWVIAGGESGHCARPVHPEWVADLRNQCAAAGVPFMFKQWGEWMPEAAMSHMMRMQDDGRWDTVLVRLDGSTHTTGPDDHSPYSASDNRMVRVGKKSAGRLLDLKTHNGFPRGAA